MEYEKNKSKELAEELNEAARKKAEDFNAAAREWAEKARRK